MTRLERRYRRLLKVLPRWYRAEREEEMVDTFLTGRDDDLDLEYGWPGWPEAWAVAVLAVRSRLATRSAPPRAVALGEVVRLVALIGLLVQSMYAVADLAGQAVTTVRLQPVIVLPPSDFFSLGGATATVLAFVMIVHGRRTWARVFAVGALVPSFVSLGESLRPEGALSPAFTVAFHAPLWISVCCLFAGFHREAPAPAARPWLLAATAASGLALLWTLVTSFAPVSRFVAMTIGGLDALPSWAIVAGGLGYLFGFRRRRRHAADAGALALASYSAALLPNLINFLVVAVQMRAFGDARDALVINAVAQVVGVTSVGLALAILGIRGFRRLPRSAPSHAG